MHDMAIRDIFPQPKRRHRYAAEITARPDGQRLGFKAAAQPGLQLRNPSPGLKISVAIVQVQHPNHVAGFLPEPTTKEKHAHHEARSLILASLPLFDRYHVRLEGE